MPLTPEGQRRIDRARRLLRKFPGGFTEVPLHCRQCGRKGTRRSVPAWRTVATHTCPGPWTLAGYQEVLGSLSARLKAALRER
jgi:hypothetical protein